MLVCALIKLQNALLKQQYNSLERLWNNDLKSDLWGDYRQDEGTDRELEDIYIYIWDKI